MKIAITGCSEVGSGWSRFQCWGVGWSRVAVGSGWSRFQWWGVGWSGVTVGRGWSRFQWWEVELAWWWGREWMGKIPVVPLEARAHT